MSFKPHTGWVLPNQSESSGEGGERGPPGNDGATGATGSNGSAPFPIESGIMEITASDVSIPITNTSFFPIYFQWHKRIDNIVSGGGHLPPLVLPTDKSQPLVFQVTAPVTPTGGLFLEAEQASGVANYRWQKVGKICAAMGTANLEFHLDLNFDHHAFQNAYPFFYTYNLDGESQDDYVSSLKFDDDPSHTISVEFVDPIPYTTTNRGELDALTVLSNTNLGTGAFVVLVTNTTLRIFLGANATITVNDRLFFLEGVLKSDLPAFFTNPLAAPTNPPVPKPNFVYQTEKQVNNWQELFGDMTEGLGGRDCEWSYSITGASTDYLSDAKHPPFTEQTGNHLIITETLLQSDPATPVKVNATVTNHFGEQFDGTVAEFTAHEDSIVMGIYCFPRVVRGANNDSDFTIKTWARSIQPVGDNQFSPNPLLPNNSDYTYTWRRTGGQPWPGKANSDITHKDLYLPSEQSGIEHFADETVYPPTQLQLEVGFGDFPNSNPPYITLADNSVTLIHSRFQDEVFYFKNGTRMELNLDDPSGEYELAYVIDSNIGDYTNDRYVTFRLYDESFNIVYQKDGEFNTTDDPNYTPFPTLTLADLSEGKYIAQFEWGRYHPEAVNSNNRNWEDPPPMLHPNLPDFPAIRTLCVIDAVHSSNPVEKPKMVINWTASFRRPGDLHHSEYFHYHLVANSSQRTIIEPDYPNAIEGDEFTLEWSIKEGDFDTSDIGMNNYSFVIPEGRLACEGKYIVNLEVTHDPTGETTNMEVAIQDAGRPTGGTCEYRELVRNELGNEGDFNYANTVSKFVFCRNWEYKDGKPLHYKVYFASLGSSDLTPLTPTSIYHPTILLDNEIGFLLARSKATNDGNNGYLDLIVRINGYNGGTTNCRIPNVKLVEPYVFT